jgi:hypothetical protein
MISVIICSVNPIQLQEVSQNISETIGLPYELIAVDNRNSVRGICSVYNEAAENAKYNYLCFVHEDVKFHTKGWGEELIQLLSDKSIGLVGVSGTVYKSVYPSTWSACDTSFYRTNCLQHFKAKQEPIIMYSNPNNSSYCETVLVDGVFMATREEIWANNQFDESNFKGFHGYDLDWSYSIRKNYKVIVTYKILIEHFSEGVLSKDWIKSSLLLHNKWKYWLPFSAEKLQPINIRFSNFLSIQNWLSVLLLFKGFTPFVVKSYFTLIFRYTFYNRLRFTKKVFLYLLGGIKLHD